MEYFKMDHEVTREDLIRLNLENSKIGVIVYIKNDKEKLLLQQRGKNARDQIGKFQFVGGSVEPSDKNYKEAILREIKEEMGDNVKLEFYGFSDILKIYLDNTNWFFIIFKCKYIDGKINIMEPEKCIGYRFFEYDEAINSDLVTEGCKFIMKSIKE